MRILASFLVFILLASQAIAERVPLLAVSRGVRPNDTALENKSTFAFVKNEILGQSVLKVNLALGDSFGMSRGGLRDWRPFDDLEVDVLNPQTKTIPLVLTIKHAATNSFRSRVDKEIQLKPGRNAVRIKLSELRNNDKSIPDLSQVRHWYVTCPGASPELFFSDFVLFRRDKNSGGKVARTVVTNTARLERVRATKMPEITRPIAFNTEQADRVLSALEVFPPDNPWNEVVVDWPLHPDSDKIIASIGRDKPLRYNPDMSFVIVPPNQPRLDVRIAAYPAESDKGPFPVPDSTPIEGWPVHYERSGSQATFADVQFDRSSQGGDRHAIVVDPVNRMLYEFFGMKRTDRGWQAAQASVFDLKTNRLRPDGWTSADAAGLPIFPAVVRYDELQRGVVEHAMRVTIRKTRRAYVHPATHYASRFENPEYPRMGERIRLRRDFDVQGFSRPMRAILRGLQTHGMLVADNGIDWAISVAPDPRIPILHEELRRVRGRDFEVIVPPR